MKPAFGAAGGGSNQDIKAMLQWPIDDELPRIAVSLRGVRGRAVRGQNISEYDRPVRVCRNCTCVGPV